MEGACRGYMFALEVTEELEFWPEQGNRRRRWVSIETLSPYAALFEKSFLRSWFSKLVFAPV